MKKFISSYVILVIITSIVSLASAENLNVTLAIGKTSAIVNGENKTLDVAPYIVPDTGRTLVPLRFIIENFGEKISWDEENKVIVVYRENIKQPYNNASEFWSNTDGYILQVNNKLIVRYLGHVAQPGWKFDGSSTHFDKDRNIIFPDGFQILPYRYPKNGSSLDQEPVIKEDRVLVPLRAIALIMDLKVSWNEKEKTILISKP